MNARLKMIAREYAALDRALCERKDNEDELNMVRRLSQLGAILRNEGISTLSLEESLVSQ